VLKKRIIITTDDITGIGVTIGIIIIATITGIATTVAITTVVIIALIIIHIITGLITGTAIIGSEQRSSTREKAGPLGLLNPWLFTKT